MLLIVGVNIYHHNRDTLRVKSTDDTDEHHPIVFAVSLDRSEGRPLRPWSPDPLFNTVRRSKPNPKITPVQLRFAITLVR